MLEEIKRQVYQATTELFSAAKLDSGQILVVGCSSSEIAGENIGSHSSPQIAQAVFETIFPICQEKGVYLAAQCCEHLNRALILQREAAVAFGYDIVNVVPRPKAGGSFAYAAYQGFLSPVAVEHIRAHAGLDIGGTLIGMHLKEVAVPVRLSLDHIGKAMLLCARTRPKFIGGMRAQYDPALM